MNGGVVLTGTMPFVMTRHHVDYTTLEKPGTFPGSICRPYPAHPKHLFCVHPSGFCPPTIF
jgi:hypothetical protein